MHQRIRKLIQVFITALMLPIVLLIIISPILVYFLSFLEYSVVITFAQVALGIWILVFISSFQFQRAHCSHTCAMTGFFVFLSSILKNRDILSMKYPKILKYIVLLLWFGGITYFLIRMFGNFSGYFHYEPIFSSLSVMFYYIMFFVSGVLSLTIGRSKTEHYICPFSPFLITGIKISEIFKIPSFKIVIDKSKCKKCKLCNKECLMNYDVCAKVNEGKFEQKECLNCAMCADACKFGAIKYKWAI